METIYLDNNATTRPAEPVVAAVMEGLRELWANPSSVHRPGQRVRQRLELARAAVASLIGAKPAELIFTSGGTESCNLALRGVLGRGVSPGKGEGGVGGGGGGGGRVLITTPMEHAAVREPAETLEGEGVEVVRLPVDDQGRVEVSAVREKASGW